MLFFKYTINHTLCDYCTRVLTPWRQLDYCIPDLRNFERLGEKMEKSEYLAIQIC